MDPSPAARRITLLCLPCLPASCLCCCSNLLLKIEFAGATYYSCGNSGLGTLDAGSSSSSTSLAGPCKPVSDLQAALQLPTDPNASPALEVGVQLAMLVVLRLLVYICLRHKTKAA